MRTCIRCSNQLEDNYPFKRCGDCLEKNKQHCKNKRKKWASENKCIKCGSPDILEETDNNSRLTRYCEPCFFKNISNKNFRTTHRWEELRDILVDQQYECAYSGLRLVPGVNAQLDHLVARNNGGTSKLENLQWVHSVVNRMKSDFTEEEFLEFVKLVYEKRIRDEELPS